MHWHPGERGGSVRAAGAEQTGGALETMRGPAFPIVVLLVLGCLPAAAVEVYKWVDDAGRVHYTDRVPEGAPAPDTVELEERPTLGPDQRLRHDRQRKLLEAFEAERREREAAEARATAEAEQRRARCDRARRQLAAVERASLVYTRDESGARRYMSDEERGRAIVDTRAWIAKWCR
ncbi:MAG: DUF4124 domain-containing protein [Gammaproteobacteria bacterium]|nr:DUF4124 domain-containing protein [Gammaproteobacteria bacterium]